MDTHQDRILRALRLSPVPLDDDELASRVGIRPRQTVNQVCRRLAAAGVVRRYTGVDGKVVNELVLARNARNLWIGGEGVPSR